MQHINSFSGGMKRGIDYTLMPQDSYSYMLNGYLVSRDNHGYVVTAIKGNKAIAQFDVDECPIGSVSFNGVLYIITHKIVAQIETICFYSIKGSDGSGWVSNTMLPLPYNGTGNVLEIPCDVLGFSTNKLLEVFAKESYDGSVDLYICDGLNANIIINTGIDKYGKYTSRKYDVLNDKTLFISQKVINYIPNTTINVRSNGNMKPGSYYIYLRYVDDSLNATPFIKEIGPVFIHSGSKVSKNSSGVFNENEARVNKNILLNITNADTNYNKIQVGIVYYYGYNGVLSRENYLLNKTYTLNENHSCNIIINGNDQIESLLLEELLKDNLPLNTCETQEQHDSRFFGANWSGSNIDLSKLAELAKYFIPRAIIKNENNFDKVCDENCTDFEYLENELYPLGVSFLIDGQYKTPVFPICGWYEGYDYDNNVLGVQPELTYDKLTEETIITPASSQWVVEHETINLIPNKFHIRTGTSKITNIELYTTAPEFAITTGDYSGLFLHLNMTIKVTEGTEQFTSASKFKCNNYLCNLYLQDETGIIFNNLVNLTFDDFDYIVYSENAGYLTLDLWKEYTYTGTVNSAAEADLEDIIISMDGTYREPITAPCSDMLDGYIHGLLVSNTNVYVWFELTTTIDITVVIKVYHADKQAFNVFTVFIENGTIGNTEIYAGLMDGQPTDDVDYIQVNYFNPNHDGYEVGESGLAQIGGGYWIDASQYYVYGDEQLPVHETTLEKFISSEYVTTPAVTSQILSVDNYKTVIPALNNENKNNGLFMFPKKAQIVDDSTNVHFKLMGVDIIDKYAKLFYAEGNMPNITAVYFMQGNRVENVICQGYSVASVEAVGFKRIYDVVRGSDHLNYELSQSTKLGNENNSIAFPLIDGNDFRLFPVIKIGKERIGGTDTPVWRCEEDAVSQLLVMNKEESLVRTGYYSDFSDSYEFFAPVPPTNDLLTSLNDFDTYFKNLKTNKYCIYSPDLLLKNNLNVNGNYYIKPIIKINVERNNQLVDDSISYTKKYSIFNQAGSRDNVLPSIANFIYKDEFSRLVDVPITEYNTIQNELLNNNATTIFVNSNEIGLMDGFSSRMKSMMEVFGEDIKTGNDAQSNTITQYFTKTREELLNAGILINRFKKTTNDENNDVPIMLDELYSNNDTVFYKYYPFHSKQICPFTADREKNSLPVVATNLSMSSIPYIGVTMPVEGKYLTGATSFDTNPDYRNMNNSIVNICKYNTLEDYISEVHSEYDLLSEEYHIIGNDLKWNIQTITDNKIWKGDVFSQKTFMRCIHWDTLPESIKNWDYSWKQGQSINMYLQSFCNTYLRVPSFDDTFYPYILKNTSKTASENIDDFVWNNTSNQFLKESWNTNSGYNQLQGVFKMFAFDELQLQINNKKPNRIYYSNKQISGAFVDQYRQFPILQYQDIGFEYGDIMKLIKFNSTLFSIQRSAINQHYSSQSLQSTNDSSEIILGNKNILSEEYKLLAEIGTQHKESVVGGENGIYGIDWNKERIWRIKGDATISGATTFGIETLEVSKSLSDIFKWLKSVLNGSLLPQDLMGEVATGIHSVYDEKNKQILFTFKLGLCLVNEATTVEGVPVPAMYDELSYTLAFSEEFDTFIGFYSFNKNIYLKFDNRLLSFTKGDKNLWEHNIGDYQSIDGVIQPFVLEVIINGSSKEQNVGNYEKEFLSHIMNSSPEDINSISWETEYQESEKNPFIDASEFWSNPEYKEHNWYIPIIENTNSNKGPKSNEEFNTFEPSSKMRGQWLKFKVTYIPEEGISQEHQFYVRSLITNLIISFT